MSLLTQDFLESRRKTQNRYKKFVLPIGIFLLAAGSFTAGLYFYQKSKEPKLEQVAGATEQSLPADWLVKYFGTSDQNDPKVGGAEGDPDGDILTNINEYYFGTDPTNPDTDGDGAIDGEELAFGLDPNGPGELKASERSDEYLRSLGPEFEQYTEANLTRTVEELVQPDRTVILEFPEDSELRLSAQNDLAAIEKYYEDTKDLILADEADKQQILENLFSMSDEELDRYIAKLEAIMKILKDTPVPSEIANIHKFRIAGITAGIRIFELIKLSYVPDSPNNQFWSDFFYQMVAAEQAGGLELLAWKEVAEKFKDQGGW